MARPRTPFNKSPQSTIFTEIERFAASHGGQCPTPHHLWRQMRAAGNPIPWSTYWYHWQQLVAGGRLVTRNGVYWLPVAAPRYRPPAPAATLQLALGF